MATTKLGDEFTRAVIGSIGPAATERTRSVFSSLIRHIHDFARENQITTEEWSKAVDMINWAGQMSDNKRNEGQLVCDVLGLES
jgi:catechol 1,2-dioxygenase